ncbi:nuclear transport factor 2 family protein, partial [Gordonia sp. (in: high G+C Gram-positive bacteria)]|uniref:nuclear transport factor 2 family protein n=1 Tax=Gordonia sp. (in: high G+C Gram-positive bacteria) TaxID=84139 RepID=UPI002FDADA51
MSTSTPAPAVPASNLTTLIAIYEAFGRGDIPSLLGLLSDDVSFEASEPPSTAAAAGHPLLSVRQGKGEVAEFFTEVGR